MKGLPYISDTDNNVISRQTIYSIGHLITVIRVQFSRQHKTAPTKLHVLTYRSLSLNLSRYSICTGSTLHSDEMFLIQSGWADDLMRLYESRSVSSAGRPLSSLQGYLCLWRRLPSWSCMGLYFVFNSGILAANLSHHPQNCWITLWSTYCSICQLIHPSNTLIKIMIKGGKKSLSSISDYITD